MGRSWGYSSVGITMGNYKTAKDWLVLKAVVKLVNNRTSNTDASVNWYHLWKSLTLI